MAKPLINLSGKYNTIAAIVAAGLVSSILIGFFLMRPAWARLQQLGQEIPVEQAKRDQAKQDFRNLQDAKKFFEEQASDVETVNAALPIQAETPSILSILEKLAVDSGVLLDGFTPQQVGSQEGAGAAGEVAGSPGGESIEITANFSGRYDALINFLYSLERNLRIVDVKVVNVNTVTQAESADPVVSGSISFLAYYKTVEGGPKPSSSAGGTAAGGTSPPAPSGGGG